MAIIFSKEASQHNLLSAYNAHKVKFSSDNVLQAVSCSIDYGDSTFNISPNPNGEFSFNLQEVASILTNDNHFRDTITPDLDSSYVYEDRTLYKPISITFKISFINGTTEQVGRNYRFIKSVVQPRNYLDNVVNVTDNSLAILLPFKERSKMSYYGCYFEGMPYDFPLFSRITQTVTIKNRTNNSEMDVDLVWGVNRVFLSQGDTDSTLKGDLVLRTGINHLEVYNDSGDRVTLFLERHESSCGPFFKFFNRTGGYSYFRFNPIYQEDLKTKTVDRIRSDRESIDETFSITDITGKDSATIMKLFEEYLSPDKYRYASEILDSPKVMLFVQDSFTKQTSSSWLTVNVSDGTYKTKDTKKRLQELKVNVGFDNYTLGL